MPHSKMKTYDQAYFDRWYRDPEHKVRTRRQLARKVAMVVGVTEHLLGRPIRSVLDVGCGEGEWSLELGSLRPSARYLGIDPSEYAVERFGKTRNLVRGSLAEVDELAGGRSWDLVACSDVLHYVPDEEIDEALAVLALITDGVAFLEVMTDEDDPGGDPDGFMRRPGDWYRQRFRDAGLVPVGMQCYAGPEIADTVLELEMMKTER